ncbi:MAG: acyltransferase [Actinobacteria bacterium]|nr:acyltransferase [Actinomycetota bacterium]
MGFRRQRDPRQARYLTWASLRWVIRNRAWSWWYLVRYWRFFWWRLRNPHIITEGFVFLGRRVQVHARKGYARLIVGRWVHVGDENRIRAHEGTMRIGDKCVFGRDNTINGYLDIEFGEGCIVADWVYVCDFDHVYDDVTYPIKDQGLVKSAVRIGPDCWLGTKVTVLRGTTIGNGCILAANSVVRGEVPPESIVAGVPGKVVKNRREVYEAKAAHRAALADIERKTAEAAKLNASRGSQPPANGGSTSTHAPAGSGTESSGA